jgi:hypothetical protein
MFKYKNILTKTKDKSIKENKNKIFFKTINKKHCKKWKKNLN